MKTRKLLRLGMVAVILVSGNAAWAQQPTAGPYVGVRSPGPERAPVFDISFPGGTLEEFVAHVEKAVTTMSPNAPKPNLIVPADAKGVRMPKLELRSVDMGTLISATTLLLSPEHLWQEATRRGPDPYRTEKSENPTWVLISRADVRKTQAYYIGHLLKKFKVADITTALETVWQMGSNAKTELKYHEDTQMLIIRADKMQIEMAQNVLTQLGNAVEPDKVERDKRLALEAAEALKNPPKAEVK